ncbi:Uncharacterised protein [Mycobacteroides abscessus subsp. abscessus]|nr:Uncharacterised protein [Mycobacteroides abscessus subsp. abscessus]
MNAITIADRAHRGRAPRVAGVVLGVIVFPSSGGLDKLDQRVQLDRRWSRQARPAVISTSSTSEARSTGWGGPPAG